MRCSPETHEHEGQGQNLAVSSSKKDLKKGKNSRIQPSSTIQSTNFLPSKKPHLVNREALLPLMEALAGLKINRQILVK